MKIEEVITNIIFYSNPVFFILVLLSSGFWCYLNVQRNKILTRSRTKSKWSLRDSCRIELTKIENKLAVANVIFYVVCFSALFVNFVLPIPFLKMK